MRLAQKSLSIILMICMILCNFIVPVSSAVADTNNTDNIILLSRGSVWKYIDNGSDQGTTWREPTFDDSSWKSGAAPLGYPSSETNSLNGKIKTVIGYGSDSSNKYPTSYFRTTFDVSDLSKVSNNGMILSGIDDAAVIYLNGHEIARTNLPSQSDVPEIGYDKYVSDFGGSLNTATEGASPTFTLDATDMSYLVQGQNVLAAEVHQGRADSSDVYWDMELVASGSSGSGGGGSGYAATDITLAPGKNATELNFAWYSNVVSSSSVVQVAKKTDMTGADFPASKATTFTGTTSAAITGFFANKVTVTNLLESTQYIYRVGDGSDANWSPVYNFTTHQTNSFSFLAVGDPQIGAGGSVESDTAGWKDTMSKALAQSPDVSFLASLGDQVNSNSNEDQFNGFFAPPELRNLPVAPLVGNHDNGAPNYSYHFNLPNLSAQYGLTTNTSSDYYFTYGKSLFMVLNTNNSSGAEHDAFMQQAIDANPNVTWKVVMFHQDIYGSANHSTSADIVNLRQALFPVFDKYKIDLVLDGHDHSYTRTYQMFGDQALTGQNVDADGAVVNPLGTLYMTLNSGSGSKYYDLQPTPETYAAVREQIKVPTFSKITETANSLNISTYRTDTMAMTDTYTIKKDTIQQPSLDLSQVTLTADGATLATEDSSSKIKLSLAGIDSQGAAVDLSGAYVVYKTDQPDILAIAADGTVTVKNKPVMDEVVKVWVEVHDGSNLVSSNQLDVNVKNPYGLAAVTLTADGNTLSANVPTIQLNLAGKDTLGTDMDLSSATTEYKTDKEGVLAISPAGIVTVQTMPANNATINISAEVSLNGKTITSNTVPVAVYVPAIEGENTIVSPVKNALDDMEERPDGSLDWDSSDLEITWESPTSADVKDQLIGIRFADLAIPKGATITNAYIQFSVDEPAKSYDPFDVNIYADDVPNSAAFENVPQTVSTRVKTANSIEWKDAPLWTTEHEAGPAEQTTNMAALVQKIVDKDEWNEGNAISFILSGIGNRTAESFEGAGSHSDQIPTLHLNYTVQAGSGNDTNANLAVAAYEAAPINTQPQITSANALGAIAQAAVGLVTDTLTKDALQARIVAKNAQIAARVVYLNVSTVTAVNGTITLTYNNALTVVPAITAFDVTQTIDTGVATKVVPTEVALDATGKIVTLTVPQVAATATAQSVVDTVSYDTAVPVTAKAFSVAAQNTNNDKAAITGFSFAGLSPAVTGSINGTNITVTVPSGTNVAALVPTITTSPDATVSPTSTEAQDFTNPVTYTVTAQDSTTQTYTVTVTVAATTGQGPTFQNVSLDPTNKIVTFVFDRSLISNVADLKSAIKFATNGTTFNALGASDTVAISSTDAKQLVVTFNSPLTGANNKLQIAANSLKDADGNVQTSVVTTSEISGTIDECFIATAAYGSIYQQPVVLLRHFRDQFLLTNSWGRSFVKFYYHNSPPIARFIAGNEFLKLAVRIMLSPALLVVYLLFHPALGSIIVLLLVGLVYMWRIKRKKLLLA
ncbi:MAG: fibronectin type III domain-containing protein [Desulfosporosinus sp.]|nr:fibronectin type III domain-containing protein [Desulfosporosinus sp.]